MQLLQLLKLVHRVCVVVFVLELGGSSLADSAALRLRVGKKTQDSFGVVPS